jgi:hypothetical protein
VLLFGTSISSAQASLLQRSADAATTAVKLSDFATAKQVEAAVKRAESQVSAPSGAVRQLEELANDQDFGYALATTCPTPHTSSASVDVSRCTFGDVAAKRTIVLTGDSRAQMWFDTVDSIASATHMRLVVLAKDGCPSAPGTYRVISNGTVEAKPWAACTAWHRFVSSTIRSLKPQLVIVSSSDELTLMSGLPTPAQESASFTAFFKTIHAPTKLAVLSGFPTPSPAQPTICLSKGPKAVSSCAFHETAQTIAENAAVQKAAQHARAIYINQTPWLCAASCPALIAGIIPYTVDGYHMDDTYAHYLTGVLWTALQPDLR